MYLSQSDMIAKATSSSPHPQATASSTIRTNSVSITNSHSAVRRTSPGRVFGVRNRQEVFGILRCFLADWNRCPSVTLHCFRNSRCVFFRSGVGRIPLKAAANACTLPPNPLRSIHTKEKRQRVRRRGPLPPGANNSDPDINSDRNRRALP